MVVLQRTEVPRFLHVSLAAHGRGEKSCFVAISHTMTGIYVCLQEPADAMELCVGGEFPKLGILTRAGMRWRPVLPSTRLNIQRTGVGEENSLATVVFFVDTLVKHFT